MKKKGNRNVENVSTRERATDERVTFHNRSRSAQCNVLDPKNPKRKCTRTPIQTFLTVVGYLVTDALGRGVCGLVLMRWI